MQWVFEQGAVSFRELAELYRITLGEKNPDDLRVAFTGTNPRPVLLAGTDKLCGGPLDARVYSGLDDLVRDQIMAMKTTFTPGHYRRRVAGVLARRLLTRLFEA